MKKHRTAPEVKEQIINRIKNDGISVVQAAKEHGISDATIYGWISKKSNHSRAYCYQVFNRQALSLLEQITPFLQTYKRNRAGIVLTSYLNVTPRNGKYTKEMLEAKEKFNKDFFAHSAPNAKRLP